MVESRCMGSLRTFFQYFCMKVFIIKCVGKIVISAYVSVNVFLPPKSCLKKTGNVCLYHLRIWSIFLSCG